MVFFVKFDIIFYWNYILLQGSQPFTSLNIFLHKMYFYGHGPGKIVNVTDVSKVQLM